MTKRFAVGDQVITKEAFAAEVVGVQVTVRFASGGTGTFSADELVLKKEGAGREGLDPMTSPKAPDPVFAEFDKAIGILEDAYNAHARAHVQLERVKERESEAGFRVKTATVEVQRIRDKIKAR